MRSEKNWKVSNQLANEWRLWVKWETKTEQWFWFCGSDSSPIRHPSPQVKGKICSQPCNYLDECIVQTADTDYLAVALREPGESRRRRKYQLPATSHNLPNRSRGRSLNTESRHSMPFGKFFFVYKFFTHFRHCGRPLVCLVNYRIVLFIPWNNEISCFYREEKWISILFQTIDKSIFCHQTW